MSLKRYRKGEARTLMEAVEANKIVDALNAWANTTVSPQGVGQFKVSEGRVVFEFNVDVIARRVFEKNGMSVACNGDGTITATLTLRP